MTKSGYWFEDPTVYINNYNYSRNLVKLDEEIAWLQNTNFDITCLYGFLSTMLYLLKTIESQIIFSQDFKTLLTQFSEMNASRLGFPNHWHYEASWL